MRRVRPQLEVMARTIWCRWCRQQCSVIAGLFLNACPKCGRIARWATEPGRWLALDGSDGALDLTSYDQRFLKRLKIAQD